MKYNKISLLSFLMLSACTLLTQSAYAAWTTINNQTDGNIRAVIKYLGEKPHFCRPDDVVVEKNQTKKINTGFCCFTKITVTKTSGSNKGVSHVQERTSCPNPPVSVSVTVKDVSAGLSLLVKNE